MSHSHLEPPRSLVAAIWSIVGLVAVFIAVGFSSIFVLRYFYPVSAEVITTKSSSEGCAEGEEKIAINNYPGLTSITKYYPKTSPDYYQHGQILQNTGGNFQCSQICVPGLSKSLADTKQDQQKVEDYLKGATIGGKEVNIVDNPDIFMALVKLTNETKDANLKQQYQDLLKRTVIKSATKAGCLRTDSVNYDKIEKAGKEVEREPDEKTVVSEAQKVEQQPSEEKPAVPPELPQPIAGAPPTKIKAPTGQVDYGSKLNQCKVEIIAIYKKYKKKTNSNSSQRDRDFQENLYITYRQFQEDLINNKTADTESNLKKCNALLSKFHKLVDQDKSLGARIGDGAKQVVSGTLEAIKKTSRTIRDGATSGLNSAVNSTMILIKQASFTKPVYQETRLGFKAYTVINRNGIEAYYLNIDKASGDTWVLYTSGKWYTYNYSSNRWVEFNRVRHSLYNPIRNIVPRIPGPFWGS